MDKCNWRPGLRWLLFIPAGIVASGLAQGIVHLLWMLVYCLGVWYPFWVGEHLVQITEPFAFLAVATWMIPAFDRTFTVSFSVLYCGFELFVMSSSNAWSQPAWQAATGVVSVVMAAVYFVGFSPFAKPPTSFCACPRLHNRVCRLLILRQAV